jgi:uncharacterized circularly permuted ATP-grasp superfamily protein
MNEAYFEHAYLARHLRFRLVEGQDLTVRDRTVYLRTIAGLRRVGALWRRLDADFCDPLELNHRSWLGVPGLVQAVAAGQVLMANALGSGLAEARALMSFLPALAEKLLGESLLLPNVATWWCGQAMERRFVLDNLANLVVAPAFLAKLPGPLDKEPEVVAEMTDAVRDGLAAAIGERGVDFVGQEVARLSTTPVWVNGRLEPRPFLLRVYVAATEDGWRVMPGELGLIGERGDARAVTMQLGLPAAYVSGYLRTVPPPGLKRLAGADASHAWVRLWCGEAAGWQALDPTNGTPDGLDHVSLAFGRDFADVSPVDGVIVASGGHTLSVSVDVIPQDEPA